MFDGARRQTRKGATAFFHFLHQAHLTTAVREIGKSGHLFFELGGHDTRR
jgi:hypothetical protein